MIDLIVEYANPQLTHASVEFLQDYIQKLHKKFNYNIWQECYFYDKRDWEHYYNLTERRRLIWKIAELEYIGEMIKRKRI